MTHTEIAGIAARGTYHHYYHHTTNHGGGHVSGATLAIIVIALLVGLGLYAYLQYAGESSDL